jgi:hypothetical protein
MAIQIVQETITHYNIKLYPPGQTIINTGLIDMKYTVKEKKN